jgi:hypothetical protein
LVLCFLYTVLSSITHPSIQWFFKTAIWIMRSVAFEIISSAAVQIMRSAAI